MKMLGGGAVVGVSSMMTLSAYKCPSYTVKCPCKFCLGILCVGNYKGLIFPTYVLSSLIYKDLKPLFILLVRQFICRFCINSIT